MGSYQKEAEPLDQDFKAVLSRLLRSGFDDAFAYVGPKYSKRRLEFRKYFSGVGSYGIEFRFPCGRWASAYFDTLRSFCEAESITYTIESRGSDDASSFLIADFGHDVDAAANFTRGVWTRVFGLKEAAPRRFGTENISPFGELVDRPDQKVMSYKEGWRHMHPGAPCYSSGKGCLLGVWSMAYAAAVFGLVISALSSAGAPPEWSLAFHSMSLSGSTESLVFMGLYVLTVATKPLLREQFRKDREQLELLREHFNKEGDQTELVTGPHWLGGIRRVFWDVVRITLPIAVVFVWTGG
jgi:hypothetical protein